MPRGCAVLVFATFAVLLTACGKPQAGARAAYSPLSEVEANYGRLLTAGNHPTPDQHGTGDRVGIFQDARGTVWGLPLEFSGDGAVLVCAPPQLREAKVTGTLPGGATVIGSTNEPTGWRGGTGNLELLLRTRDGAVRRETVKGADLEGGAACRAADSPGPAQRLQYYRLTFAASGKP